MLQKVILALSFFIFAGCASIRENEIEKNEENIKKLISKGDDIFFAEKKLRMSGYRIYTPPSLALADNSMYMMAISYGYQPTAFENFRSSTDTEGYGKKIYTVIWADSSGDIVSIGE